MKVFAIIFVLCAVSFLNLAQTNKPKPKTQTAKPKATPSKKSTAAKFKPKTTATPAKKNTAAKSKPSAAPSKPPTTAKQKSSVTPLKKPDEKAAWEKAVITDPRDARIAALQKFNETFPKSTRKKEALTLIALLRTDTGNEKLAASETDGAAAVFRAAATDAPKPIPEQLWTEALSKIAANLYFRGARDSAIEIEKTLESKADGNLKQLLDVANFYMMIENGGEARRVSLNAIALDPNSSVAYQTLGLANRIDFQLFGSASAYERALELDPTSLDAKRGLAEMKRALGKADESVALYREILTADANSLPAQTGLILALFDADKRADAEAELARSLEANPGNVILLAGAAYWYAAHNEGVKAVELARKAIDSDPRFIWSHIALARGLLMQNRAADAEKTLLAARRYGNFPTVEYELASARLAAGYYREAAEGLRSVFKITDGKVSTNLGGRVARDALNLKELVGDERRASIFAPTAADDSENAARLAGLLELRQQLDSAEINDQNLAAAVDQFVKGGDRMKVYRQIFAASQLLEKKTALLKVLELTKAATLGVDDGLAGPNSTIAVMANELYESRAIAATKGEYIVVPDLPRHTLSAVLRGRVEEIAGWAQYNLGSADEAIIRLRRAIGVLPADSTWWRSSTWRLGAAYALAGKHTEALDMYIKSYKSAERPDVIRYGVIESQYRKVNGSTEGLADKIGPNLVPKVAPETIALKTEAPPIPTPEVKPDPTPEIKIEPAPTPDIPKPIPSIVPVATPSPEEIRPVPTPLTEVSPTPEAAKPTPSAELSPIPSPETTPEPQNSPTPQPTPDVKTEVKTRELFPPVIITIPVPSADKPTASETKPEPSPTPASAVEPTPAPTPVPTPTPTPESPPIAEDVRARIVETKPDPPAEIVPCKITVSEETINLKSNSGKLAVIVGLDNDNDVDSVQASSSSPKDVTVRREPIAGLTTRALFVLQSLSDRLGVYQVTFEMSCGKRTIAVNVR
ncbi:MAG: hypothetical protein WBD16_15260 [Pyrinomonadaceae bacterium]